MTRSNYQESGHCNRRSFIQSAALALGAYGLVDYGGFESLAKEAPSGKGASLTAADLPVGSAPKPVALLHFPDRLHAFVWRNWQLVPAQRMAEVVGAHRRDIVRLGRNMGLEGPPRITAAQQRRSILTVIRRNWHLLPYDQLLRLLGWTAEQMAFALREDDFLFVKLGNLKPQCDPLKYQPPEGPALDRAAEIARILRAEFPQGVGQLEEPLFAFVNQLSRAPKPATTPPAVASAFDPRFCYSYFALYGDPLLEPELDPYPDGYLAALAAAGVNGVWLQAVLTRLAPFPWDPKPSQAYKMRLDNLRRLVDRARRYGLGIYLYLNEPRAWPIGFYSARPHLKGVTEGDFAALCTSVPEVRDYLASALESICRAVPGLAGFFTITGSENLTHCWSHSGGAGCARCGKRRPAEVIAELNATFQAGIQKAGSHQTLIVWDWGWPDAWVEDIIAQLPQEAMFMSVSEWAMPIRRGAVETTVEEYSISTVGPGERARRHWKLARQRGLKTIAKIQCANTWELSAVPYVPALANVAQHIHNLGLAGVDGLMLGWTLGGYPSPNLEVVKEMGAARVHGQTPNLETVLIQVAERRFGKVIAAAVVLAWQEYSRAFSEFPFHGSLVYNAPLQVGPANLLWNEPTGYHATMVGFPYDDLEAWRAVYPPEVFVGQFEKVANGFEQARASLANAFQSCRRQLSAAQQMSALQELSVGEAAAIHFRSTANQARFILARRRLKAAKSPDALSSTGQELARIIRAEIDLARRLHAVQTRDSRIGFEASNQYYYVPVDLAEKVINGYDLLNRWLPAQVH